MDERQKRILASLVAGSALSLTLGVTASAEGVETPEEELTPTTVQAPQAPVTNEGNSTNTENNTSETKTTTETETTIETETTTESKTTTETETSTESKTTTETETTTESETTTETETSTERKTTTETETTTETKTAIETETTTETKTTTESSTSTPEGSGTSQTVEKAVTYTTPETNPTETETAPPVVTVKNGALTSGSENWDAENMAGLRYDAASGSVVMVNNANAVTIQTDGKGVNFSVAGVNRISTLYADGDVNITGTGIVLIDSIDMLQGTNLNLLTNTNIYTEGSAAVFLKNEEGKYVLINGEVSGILDEEYTIPEGITLVVPDGGTLDMRVTTTVTTKTTDSGQTQSETHYGFTEEEKQILESDREEDKKIFTETGVEQEGVLVHKSAIFSTPKLNIAANSVLHIQEGGQMLMNAFRNEALGVSNGSTLEVSGILGLDGEIRAYQGSGVGQAENFYLNVKDTGFITGLTENGTLSGVTAIYEDGAGDGDTLNITGDGSYVKINKGGIAELTTNGNTGVVFDDDASIGSIAATEGGSVTFYATDCTAQMKADAIAGAYDISSGYVKVGQNFAKETVSTPTEGEIPFLSNGGIMGQKETSVAHLEFWKDMSTLGQEKDTFWKSKTFTYSVSNAPTISFDSLSGNAETRGFDYYEVFVQEGDDIRLYLLNKDSAQSLSAKNICQIRGVNFNSRITVGEEVLNGSSNSGWPSGSTGSGWRYDGSSFSMVNNGNAVSIKAEGKGVDFGVAGLNRIGTLYADGDVNITGTGIVLIDSLDLKKDAKLNLLNIEGVYESGSAAVFLKNEKGEYVLINGSVTGILDEEYTIPSGITLVVPGTGVLDMRVTRAAAQSGTYGYSAPKLTVSSGAALNMDGKLQMNAFRVGTVINSSTLQINGTLRLNGTLSVYRNSGDGEAENFSLNVMSGGSVTGNGTITGVTAIYETGAGNQDKLNIAGDGSYVKLNSGGIASLTTTGNTGVVFGNGASVGSIAATGSGSVTFYGVNYTDQMRVVNTITGNHAIGSGYVAVRTGFAKESFSTPVQGSISFLGGDGVKGEQITSDPRLSYWKNMGTQGQGDSFWESKTLTYSSAPIINFGYLFGNTEAGGCDFYEVYVQEGNAIKLYLLDKDSTRSLSAENICQIRGVNFYSSLTVGDKVLDSATDAGWNTGSGWRYDGSSVSMVNNGAAVNIKAEGKGVDFSMAGLNRIGTLYSDGDVNITGTGIVLIESLDLQEGAKLNLLTNTEIYQDGSAAVFLKNEKGEYVLINKNVVGILDEEYTIPKGVKLVVPKGGQLDMRITTQVGYYEVDSQGNYVKKYRDYITGDDVPTYNQSTGGYDSKFKPAYEGDTYYRTISFKVPQLTIAQGASLNIMDCAQMRAQSFYETITDKKFCRSTLVVEGSLVLDGSISAFGASNCEDREFILDLKNTGSVTGSGSLYRAGVQYYGGSGTVRFAGSSNFVDLQGSGDLNIVANAQTDVYYNDGRSISSVTANSPVTFYVRNSVYSEQKTIAAERLDIRNSLTGSYSVASGYVRVNGRHANETFQNTGADENGNIRVQFTQGTASYDNAAFRTDNYYGSKRDIPYCVNGTTGSYAHWTSKTVTPISDFSYNNLKNALGEVVSGIPDPAEYALFEVFSYDAKTGCVTLSLITQNNAEAVINPDQVFLIRGVNAFSGLAAQLPASTGVNPGTSNTGSGVLGGENAGSLTGGNASGVWNGDRTNQSEGQSGSLTGTNTGSTGSGVLGGGSSLTGGSATGVLGGGRENPSGAGQGGSLTGTNTGATGSGVLGSGSSLVGGKPVGVLSGSRKPPAPPATSGTEQQVTLPAAPKQEASQYDLVLKVTGTGTTYDLSAFYDGIELKELGGGTVTVEMEVRLDPSWNQNNIFAVFRDARGKLVAVRVRYDPRTGKLEFDAPMLGQFRLVNLDWDGTDYGDEAFLAAIAACMS